jgi:uncharacterized protein YndB with AHSA1/START domain
MADLKLSIEIAVPPNELFAFFIPQRMPLWYGTEMRARFEVPGGRSEFAVGQKVRITGSLGTREVRLTTTVAQCEWGKLFAWQCEDSYGVEGTQRWEFEAVACGTRLTMRDTYRMPGLYGRIVDRILTRFAVGARDRSWLTRLQRLASTGGC